MIILDILLMLGSLLFAFLTITKRSVYDTGNDNTDKLIITILWLSVFAGYLGDVINYLK